MIVFDANFLLHRSLKIPDFYGMQYLGQQTGGVYGVLQALSSSLSGPGPTQKRIVVWDGRKSERRLRICPDYKGNRKPKTDQEKQESQEYFASFVSQQKLLRDKILPTLGFLSVTFPTKEADDVIYQVVKMYHNEYNVIVISEDSDLLQLLTHFDNVKIFQPIKKRLVNRTNFQDYYNIPIEVFLYYKSIIGDKSDNIKGITGVAEKTAIKFLSKIDINNINDSLYKVAVECNKKYEETKKGVREANLYKEWSKLAVNLSMIDLSREDFLNSDLEQLRSFINNSSVEVFPDHFKSFCNELGFKSILNNFEVWIAPFKNISFLNKELLKDLHNEISL